MSSAGFLQGGMRGRLKAPLNEITLADKTPVIL
jgi:hypothetical protein